MLRNAFSLVKVSFLKAVGTDLLGLCDNGEKRSVSVDLKLQLQCFFFFFSSFVSKTQKQLASFADFNDPKRAAACQQMILPSLILRENAPERNTRVLCFLSVVNWANSS